MSKRTLIASAFAPHAKPAAAPRPPPLPHLRAGALPLASPSLCQDIFQTVHLILLDKKI